MSEQKGRELFLDIMHDAPIGRAGNRFSGSTGIEVWNDETGQPMEVEDYRICPRTGKLQVWVRFSEAEASMPLQQAFHEGDRTALGVVTLCVPVVQDGVVVDWLYEVDGAHSYTHDTFVTLVNELN
jgi:hypothetical protein